MTRSDGDEMLPTMRRLGEHLHAAAQREIERPAPARRPPRRLLAWAAAAVAAVCVIGVWALLGSDDEPQARLIAVGQPVAVTATPGPQPDAQLAQPAPDAQPDAEPAPPPATDTAVELSLIARAPNTPTAFAVGVYRSSDGEACAVAGRVQNIASLDSREGRFPAVTGEARLCGTPTQGTALYTARIYEGANPTTAVFGRAPTRSTQVTIRSPAGTHTAPTGPGNAFLLIYKGAIAPQNLTVSADRSRHPGP